MLLTRLYLRNFRVYEDALDLALPPGLVGIYGVNGAGKTHAAGGRPLDPVGQGPDEKGADPCGRASAVTASPRSSSSTRVISTWCAAP